jgi:hypothetical protein
MSLEASEMEALKRINSQARSFCRQFEEGAISLSEFLFAAIALEAANRDVVARMHDMPWNEQPVQL